MYSFLEKIMQKQKLVSVYDEIDRPGSSWAGYVAAVNEEHIVLSCISPNGIPDGLLLLPVQKIFRVEEESRYLEKIKRLSAGFKAESPELSGNLAAALFDYAKKNRYIVSIEFNDSGNNDIIGYVEQYTEDECEIAQISEDGLKDGQTVFLTEHITQISCNGQQEKNIRRLNMGE